MRYSRPAFELDGRPVSFGSVVALGMVSGQVPEDFATLRDRLACDAFLDREGRGVTGAEITPALNAWRTERGLTSAELTRGWLQTHELELADLAAHIGRTLAALRIGEERARALTETPAPFARAIALLLDHLLLEGRLPALLEDATMRAAVAPPEDDAAYRREQRRLDEALAETGGSAGLAELFEITLEEAAEVLAMQVRFQLADAETTSPAALAAELRRSGRALSRVEYAEVVFPEEGAAREAVATLRDGHPMWLEQLAHHFDLAPTRHRRLVEELGETATGTRLASGSVGDVFGPEVAAAGYAVYEVLGREAPTIEDPEVRARLERRVRKRAHAAAIERRIRPLFL